MANANRSTQRLSGGTLGDVMTGRASDFPNTALAPAPASCSVLVHSTLTHLVGIGNLVDELEAVISQITGDVNKMSSDPEEPMPGPVIGVLRLCAGRSGHAEERLRYLINNLRETLGV